MKFLLVLLLLIQLGISDTVLLSSGKKITGRILSYSQSNGLTVETDFGEITIKPGNLVSFEIDTVRITKIEEKVKYSESKLWKQGIILDTSFLDGYDVSFDSKLENTQFEFLAINNAKSIYLIMGTEEIGLENKEYLNLIEQNIRNISQYFVDGESWEIKTKKVNALLRSFKVKLNGIELSYYVSSFVANKRNYRVIMWGFPTIIKKEKALFEKFLKNISVKKEKK